MLSADDLACFLMHTDTINGIDTARKLVASDSLTVDSSMYSASKCTTCLGSNVQGQPCCRGKSRASLAIGNQSMHGTKHHIPMRLACMLAQL